MIFGDTTKYNQPCAYVDGFTGLKSGVWAVRPSGEIDEVIHITPTRIVFRGPGFTQGFPLAGCRLATDEEVSAKLKADAVTQAKCDAMLGRGYRQAAVLAACAAQADRDC